MTSKTWPANSLRQRIRDLISKKIVKSQKDIAAEIDLDAGQLSSFDNPLDLFDAIIYEHPDDPTIGRCQLEQALKKHLDDKDYAWSDTHRLIQDLPWHAIFTTNYDNLLARLTGETPVASENTYYRLSERPVPRLFQIHGTLDNPHTLTREDYRLWHDRHPQAWYHL